MSTTNMVVEWALSTSREINNTVLYVLYIRMYVHVYMLCVRTYVCVNVCTYVCMYDMLCI